MKITVLVPTYHRSSELRRCLEALIQQTRLADEVLVIVREDDCETWQCLDSFNRQSLPIRAISVSFPGLIFALNTGLDNAQGDIISITDDDAVPHRDWLERIEKHFMENPEIAGVGGRDLIQPTSHFSDSSAVTIGRLQWFGRVIGNHHLGCGSARIVDVLKGVNMSYRTSAIGSLRFDHRLQGQGAQVHNELAFCLALKRQNCRLIYDPKVAVKHYVVSGSNDHHRQQKFNAIALSHAVHNETLTLLEHLSPAQKLVFIIWAILIGNRAGFGIIQVLRFLPTEGKLAISKFQASLIGRWAGLKSWNNSRTSGSSPLSI